MVGPDLGGGDFIDELQMWDNDTAKFSAATGECVLETAS